MKMLNCTSLAIVVFIVAGGVLTAQQSPATEKPSAHVIHLDVAVRDAKGMPVRGLGEHDFTVLDNKAVQPIASFAEIEQEKSPASVLIVIDAVNAPVTAVSFQRDQLVKFLRANDGHLASPTSIGILTDKTMRLSNATTTNGNGLADSLSQAEIGLRDIHRDAGFYGAQDRMDISLNALREVIAAAAKLPGRKLVVWISPGWPLISGAEVELTQQQQKEIYAEIVRYSTVLREARITLYDVNSWGADEGVGHALYYENFLKGVSKPSQTDLGDLGLQVLALQSGGLVQNSNDVGKMLQRCVADAGEHYEISFETPAADKNAEYHSLDVRVDKPGATARTRQGYYTAP